MDKLLADAEVCVKCGLCLPHCPTYVKTQNENESPRGRIALIQAWAGRQLPASKKLLTHIDNCLLCRACEKVCPALVPYGRLVDGFRAQVHGGKHASLASFALRKMAHSKRLTNLAKSALVFYQISRVQKTARFLRLPKLLGLDKVERLINPASTAKNAGSWGDFYAARSELKGDVGLFTGCMGTLLDHETVQAAIQLITLAGFNVHLPAQQTCCGALDLHQGDQASAEQLAVQNIAAFAHPGLQAIITVASGCGSLLCEYPKPEFAGKVIDLSAFLKQDGLSLGGVLQALPATAVLHTPCSLKNVMRQEQGVSHLLLQIPQLKLIPLPENQACCGSAGTYLLEHPGMAEDLSADLLSTALKYQPDYLISSNIGCALHLAAGLRERGISLPVLHPAVLLARQLPSAYPRIF